MALSSSLFMPSPAPALCFTARCPSTPTEMMPTTKRKKKKRSKEGEAGVGGLSHLAEVVVRDADFLKNRIRGGVHWASHAFRLPRLRKTLDDLLWLRAPQEDPHALPARLLSWPQPFYPELSGMDLFMADLKALEAYAIYFYSLSKVWSRPLPEFYDPQEIADYFSCRPHLIALRLTEVFSSFVFAAIKIRILGLWKLYRPHLDTDGNENLFQYDFGVVLKETMLNLGPTFIKVGQSLSTRPDIIGFEISKALSELHDQIPPFPREVALKIIEDELGSSLGTNFSYISDEPVAAASFGQVYRGTTLDGYSVAVKVQRPNLRHLVVRDIYILRLGLGLLRKIAKRKSDLSLYADELGKGFVGELDYTLEAANAAEFQEAHSSFPFIRVPKIFHHLTSERVLTMEWLVGESPSDLLFASRGGFADHCYSEMQQLDAKRRLLDLVNKGVEASLIQLLETGILHADPHPGNLRYSEAGEIGFLDFGLICRMERKHQFAMLASIVHIVNGDWVSLVRALSEMDVITPGTNIRRVTMELKDALGEVEFKDGIPNVKFSQVLGKIWSVALKYHFRMPAYYTLVLRSLASLEGLAVAADKNFKTFEAAYPYVVRKLLTDNSIAARRILHLAVLNTRKEFQWQRLALFLRVGAMKKSLPQIVASDDKTLLDSSPNGAANVFDVTNLILRLLPSKNGVVLRRLLMTVDGTSLVKSLVSSEGVFVRQQLCQVLVDIIYKWMIETIGQRIPVSQLEAKVRLLNRPYFREMGRLSVVYEYETILRDRRLKVVFYKLLDSLRKYPVLMLRLCWTSFALLAAASALACHRTLVSLFEVYRRSVSLAANY